MRRCKVCGAVLNTGTAHRHEDAEWRPMYDDFEGALEGYETVPGAGLSGKTSDEKTEPEPHESERIAELAAREAEPNPYRSQDQIVRDQERTRILALLDSVEAEEAVVNALMAAVDAGADLGSEARAAITALVGLVERGVPNG